jgi:serine/threonine-protein kinase
MHADPRERYATADELRLALQRYLDHRGSDALAVGAQARLGQLRAALAAGDEDEVHRLFGACRFGFHEALSAWPENAAARAGLTEATIAVAEFELAHDAPAAAVALLGELDPPPPLLATARAAAESRRASLATLEQAHDLSVNLNVRSLVLGGTTAVFTVAPLLIELAPRYAPSVAAFATVHWIAFLVAIPIATILSRRYGNTVVDRQLVRVIPLTFLMQAVLLTGAWCGQLSFGSAEVMLLLVMATVLGLSATLAEPRLAPAAAAYLIAFGVAAYDPSLYWYCGSAANGVFAVSAFAWYRSRTVRGSGS